METYNDLTRGPGDFKKPLEEHLGKIFGRENPKVEKLVEAVKSVSVVRDSLILDLVSAKLELEQPLSPQQLSKLPQPLQEFARYHRDMMLINEHLRLNTDTADADDKECLEGLSLKLKKSVYAPLQTDQGVYFLSSDKPSRFMFAHHEGGKARLVKNTPAQEYLDLLLGFLKIPLSASKSRKKKMTLPKIKGDYLLIEKKHMADLHPIADALEGKGIEKVVKLRVDKCGLTSTSGVERFPSLLGLFLQNNSISDLTGLRQATQLEVLDLSNNRIGDLSGLPLSGKLEQLTINSNLLETLDAVTKLPALEYLLAHGNPLKSLPPELINLKKLNRFVYDPCHMDPAVKNFLKSKKLLR